MLKYFVNGGKNMQTIINPQTGEKGFFCTYRQKVLIDAIVSDFNNQHILQSTSHDSVGDDVHE